jgi:hypothetical protein
MSCSCDCQTQDLYDLFNGCQCCSCPEIGLSLALDDIILTDVDVPYTLDYTIIPNHGYTDGHYIDGVYTVPINNRYRISANVCYAHLDTGAIAPSDSLSLNILLNGDIIKTESYQYPENVTGEQSISIELDLFANTNDLITITFDTIVYDEPNQIICGAPISSTLSITKL